MKPSKRSLKARAKREERRSQKAARKLKAKAALEKAAEAERDSQLPSHLKRLKRENPERFKLYQGYLEARQAGRPTASGALFEAKARAGTKLLREAFPKSLSPREAEFVANYYAGLSHQAVGHIIDRPKKSAMDLLRRKGYKGLKDFAKLYLEFRRMPSFEPENPTRFASFLTKKFSLESYERVVFSSKAWEEHYGTSQAGHVYEWPYFTDEVRKEFERFEREKAVRSLEAEKFFIGRLKATAQFLELKTTAQLQKVLRQELAEQAGLARVGLPEEDFEFYKRMLNHLITLTGRQWRAIGLKPPKPKKR